MSHVSWLWTNPASYNFFSSVFGELALKVPLILIAYKHVNCDVRRCWRLGHPVEGTGHRACRRHHPNMRSSGTITPDIIQEEVKQ